MPLIFVPVSTISALLLVFLNVSMSFAGSIYESTEEYISIYTKFKTSDLDKKVKNSFRACRVLAVDQCFIDRNVLLKINSAVVQNVRVGRFNCVRFRFKKTL